MPGLRSALAICLWPAAVASALSACTPEIPPTWLISAPTEVGLHVEVSTQGPYGERFAADDPRTVRDALPLDHVTMRPLVVDVQGPIASEQLDLHWVMCPSSACLGALADPDALDACDPRANPPLGPCRLGRGGRQDLELPDLPALPDDASLLTLLAGPTVAFIGSPRDGRGADACALALAERRSLAGCLVLIREIRVGPASALLELASERGHEIELTPGNELLALVPRNHNPLVAGFEVSRGLGHPVERVANGTTLRVTPGATLAITYVPEDADIDTFNYDESDDPLVIEETLIGEWRATALTERFSDEGLFLELDVPPDTGTFNAFFLLRDSGGSEAFGWLAFDGTE